MRHAQKKNSVSTVNAEEGVIKMEGRYCQGGRTHTHTHPTVQAKRPVCIEEPGGLVAGRLDPARPGKVVMNHSAGTSHRHLRSASSVSTTSTGSD